jgi:hypothetical protein
LNYSRIAIGNEIICAANASSKAETCAALAPGIPTINLPTSPQPVFASPQTSSTSLVASHRWPAAYRRTKLNELDAAIKHHH